MKNLLIISSALILLGISCAKKGCNDESALNYSADAKKDDGSCTYYSKAIINSITLKNFPNVNDFGDAWDNTSTADPYILIEDLAFNALHQTDAKIDESAPISWEITPSLTIKENSLGSSLTFYVYDEDGTIDDEMGELRVSLNDYTHSGTQNNKYPSIIQKSAQGCTIELGLVWEE